MQKLGAEAARKRLPELIDRASAGEISIISKRGIPKAAIVPVDQCRSSENGGLIVLKGSGRNLWGKNVTTAIDQMRKEWE